MKGRGTITCAAGALNSWQAWTDNNYRPAHFGARFSMNARGPSL
jgi:hypothetical protein